MPTKIIFLLLPHANLMDFGGASQVFIEAKDQGLEVEIDCCSYQEKLVSSVGMPLGTVKHYQELPLQAGDFLFIVSASIDYILSEKFKPDTDLLNWINKSYQDGAYICSICNGAFLLGRTGLLDRRKCTTHWKRTGELQTHFPLAKVQENILFIEDQRIITSAGGASGVDVALYILSKLKGDLFSHSISRELVVYIRRVGSESQKSAYLDYRNHVHQGIHQVQDYLTKHLHQKHSLGDLAEMANMSYRNFCRIFKKETSLTVVEYINKLRKEKIEQLSKNPNISKQQLANACGLTSERQVQRIINSK